MTTPALLGLDIGVAKKRQLRDMLSRAAAIAAHKAGYDSEEEHIAAVAVKNDANLFELYKLRARVEPKEVAVTADDSLEALMIAFERKQRGEIVVYADEKQIENAEFTELPVRETLWSKKVIRACV